MQLFKQVPTPCFTYQLYSYHKNRFKRKRSITQIKQIFQTRSQQFQHHSVVFTTRAKIVNLRYTIQEKRKKLFNNSIILYTKPFTWKTYKQYFNISSFKHFNSTFIFFPGGKKKPPFLIKPPSSLNTPRCPHGSPVHLQSSCVPETIQKVLYNISTTSPAKLYQPSFSRD